MTALEKFIAENQEKLVKIHWNDIVNNYSENIGLSKILLNDLGKDEYFNPLKDFFKSINKNIDNYIENSVNPSYQIAIVGAIKAGKSTLINALIGHDLASTNVTPETATLTKFKYSKNNSLKVKFYTVDEWNEIWENAQEKKADIFLEEYSHLKAEEVKDYLLGKKEIYQEFSSIDEMKEEIVKWTSSQKKEHYFVKELEIGLNDLKLPEQICLVDTPGLNDIIDYRSKITRDYIDSANAVLICVNAKTLRNEEMLTIARVFSKAKYKKDKIYILGTQIDTMNSFENWLTQREEWLKILRREEYFETMLKAKTHLLGISSYAYSKAITIKTELTEDDIWDLNELKLMNREEARKSRKLVEDGLYTKEMVCELKERIINYSRIEHLRDIIQVELLKDFNDSLVKDFVEKYKILKSEINLFGKKHKEILEDKKKELEMTSEELTKKIEAERERVREIERINNELEEKIKETTRSFNMDFSELGRNFKKLEEGIKKINID